MQLRTEFLGAEALRLVVTHPDHGCQIMLIAGKPAVMHRWWCRFAGQIGAFQNMVRAPVPLALPMQHVVITNCCRASMARGLLFGDQPAAPGYHFAVRIRDPCSIR